MNIGIVVKEKSQQRHHMLVASETPMGIWPVAPGGV